MLDLVIEWFFFSNISVLLIVERMISFLQICMKLHMKFLWGNSCCIFMQWKYEHRKTGQFLVLHDIRVDSLKLGREPLIFMVSNLRVEPKSELWGPETWFWCPKVSTRADKFNGASMKSKITHSYKHRDFRIFVPFNPRFE